MMQQQMSLFQEGGLEQDGGTVDPVSGNEVPVGSSQEEVRDDIPAQLSEGEFVFPADVVRFLGLEFLMNLRQRAKAGLKRMEEMGQMGNSEEATIPDDVPFTIDDLDMEDDPQEMAQGGVMAANGIATVRGGQNLSNLNVDESAMRKSGFRRDPELYLPYYPFPYPQPPADEQATFYDAPPQPITPEPVQPFDDLFGGDVSYGYDELRKYVGPNGEIEYIAFKDGQPLPAYAQKLKDLTDKGYTYTPPSEEEEDPTDVGVDTAQVIQKDKEGDSTSFENMQKRENQIQENYKNAIRRVMEQEGLSAKDAVQFIKDGNYTVMGKKVPGFLFPDIKLANQSRNQQKFIPFSLEEAANQVQQQITSAEQFDEQGFVDDTGVGKTTGVGFDALGNTTNLKVASPSTTTGTSNISKGLPPAEQVQKELDSASDKPIDAGPPSLSDRPVGKVTITGDPTVDEDTPEASDYKTREVQDPSDLATVDAEIKRAKEEATEKRRRAVETARLKAMAEAEQRRKDEAEATRAKANKQKTKKESTRIQNVLRDRGKGSIRRGFKEGGIASKKPKKKVMKRGGLASKK